MWGLVTVVFVAICIVAIITIFIVKVIVFRVKIIVIVTYTAEEIVAVCIVHSWIEVIIPGHEKKG